MLARSSFDYAIVRVVPRVERGEFINAGVILYCLTSRFLSARVELDENRLAALAPEVDMELVRGHLESIPRICAGGRGAGPIGQLPQKERWHWLVAPRSTILQTSPVHSGLCEAPDRALEHLMDRMVR
ncbi:DUF3037 domain-containing protein [Stigmatella sp. ncwal1]|uniref:DUF3037 domain-containing protein n=1 Tax=Stigmatella ashevillensis TaxID=2995309 RepID=A0ABT5DCE1_9BACT|nr:DUF3037 domain-containing protein [Stigmatella ashevillena]MDC0711342.1 DUF3037 domain-containing protein [Stigmatella ashevillena]